MARSEKKIDFSEIMKNLMGLPCYGEETPRKFVSYRVKSPSCTSMATDVFNGDDLTRNAEHFNDSEFFDSETGKNMILADTASRLELSLQRKDPNSTACSSWVNISRANFSQESNVQISQYMKAHLHSLDGSLFQMSSFDPDYDDCSTPVMRRTSVLSNDLELQKKDVFDFSNLTITEETDFQSFDCSWKNQKEKLTSFNKNYPFSLNKDVYEKKSLYTTPTNETVVECYKQPLDFFHFSNLTITEETDFQSFDYSSENYSLSKKNHLFSLNKNAYEKKPLYTTPKKDSVLECYKQSLGYSNYKRIQRLRAEESRKSATVTGESSTDSFHQRDFVTPRSSELNFTQPIRTDWLIEPTDITLDSSKGARVLLINNSSRNLKFSSKFDSKIANVCPWCGMIPARGKTGLRIVISSLVKKSLENVEEEIKIIVGKEEKAINLKIMKGQKAKTLKLRSFITF